MAELTDPLEASVVAVAHSAESAIPKRCSLPSRLPPVVPSWASVLSAGVRAGEPCRSAG